MIRVGRPAFIVTDRIKSFVLVVLTLCCASCGGTLSVSGIRLDSAGDSTEGLAKLNVQTDVDGVGTVAITSDGTEAKQTLAEGSKFSVTIPVGKSIQITAQPEPGYRFDHWSGDVDGNASTQSLTIANGLDITASFARKSWAVLVYMMADNNLEQYAIADLNAMETVDLTTGSADIAVLVDRSPQYDTSDGDWSDTRLYQVRRDPTSGPTVITSPRASSEELGISSDNSSRTELNTGSPTTLQAFLEWANREYPGEKKLLALWGHCVGWDGTGSDDSSAGDTLTLPELSDALSAEHVDIVSIDGSFGATIERADQLSGTSDYYIASQTAVPDAGWDYASAFRIFDRGEISGPNGSTDSATVSKNLAASIASAVPSGVGVTVSAIDLSRIGTAVTSLNRLSDALYARASTTVERDTMRNLLFSGVTSFYSVPGHLFLDLGSLATSIASIYPSLSSQATALKDAAESTLLSVSRSSSEARVISGLSVYFVALSADGTATTHESNYFRNGTGSDGVVFVSQSTWVPYYPAGPGLLYRLWYESLP